MRDNILKVLEYARGNALSIDDVFKRVGGNYDEFYSEFLALVDEKKIYCTNSKSGMYILNPFFDGIFHIKRNGDCYVSCDLFNINIDKNKTYGCLEGDKVRVRLSDYNTFNGSIKEIIKRHGLICELKTIGGKRFAIVDNNTKYLVDVDKHIVDGTIIGIEVDKKKSGKYYKAKLDRVIGYKNAPRIDEMKILYNNEFAVDFSKEALEEVKNIPSFVTDEEINLRKEHDLREKVIFTIDGDDTKDIDDAISLERLDNGNYLLGVHIADVSYYVLEDSYLDMDARSRGTSVYMPGVVSPMYPVFLSNGICSLNPNVDRLAFTCSMEINNKGDIVSFDIYKSVIKSRIQMTYNKVNDILDNNIIAKGYEDYVDILKDMKELSDILDNNRKRRGSLDFSSSEVKVNVDDKGKVLSIGLKEEGVGEKLIENFMLCANECVATYIYNMGICSIYRDHDYPSLERLKKVIGVIKSYGENVNTKFNINDPLMLQKLLIELKSSKNFDIYSSMLLRCMAKACYDIVNIGHFGIGINANKKEAYTHFTSPIRRYPDTCVHRVLSYILDGKFDKLNDNYKMKLKEIADSSSERELAADRCEREAVKMKMALYMKDYVGSCFASRIVGFSMHGMFVMLSNNVEGRIDFSSMDDYYRYDEDLEIIVGDRKRKVYRLGDEVNVCLVRSCVDTREIDFEIVRESVKNKHFVKGKKYGNSKQKGKI